MEPTIARERIEQFREMVRAAASCDASTFTHAEVERLVGEFVGLASDIFGPESAQAKDARVSFPSAEEFARRQTAMHGMRGLSQEGSITRIHVPEGNMENVFRRAFTEMDEQAQAFLMDLREERGGA